MLRLTLFWKIFASTTVLIVFTALLVGWLSAGRLVDDARDRTADSLRARAVLLADAAPQVLRGNGGADSQVRIVALGRATRARLTIISADGRVLADSAHEPGEMENHDSRPEILEARVAPFGEATRRSATLDREMMYVARRVEADGQLLGYVRATLPLVEVDERLAQLRAVVAGAAGLAILVGLLLALWVARRLTGPLRAMTEAATAIAEGDYERSVRSVARDEVGTLAAAFNAMADQLRDRISTISRDRAELQTILSGMVEGVIAVDQEERLVLMNDAAARMLGVDAAEGIGSPIWERVRIGGITETVSQAIRDEGEVRSRVRIAEAGRDRVLQLTAAPLAVVANGGRGAVLVIDDVTALERLEAVRRDFVANASHELRTPISALRGLVETILDDADMPDETRRGFLDRIRRQSQRLGELVDEMLVLSRLDSTEVDMPLAPIDLGEPVRDAIDAASDLARERGVRVETALAESPVVLLGNRDALRRVAGNLLDNAVKYTPAGGRIVVRLAREDDGRAVLEIRDDGPGIPLEKQERLFERFYRVDEGRSRDRGGTGLGLAIVKHLVDAMNGSIDLVSRPGAGTTFWVHFPPD